MKRKNADQKKAPRYQIPLNKEERKEYVRGREAGRKAAKLGSQKSTDFNTRPIYYKKGYDDTYALVEATLSEAEIQANREQNNRSKRVSPQQKKRRKTNQSPRYIISPEQQRLMGDWDIKIAMPQSSALQPQGNPIESFSEYPLEANNLELSLEINPEDAKDVLKIIDGEKEREQSDLDTPPGNLLKQEKEIIDLLKQLNPPNKLGKKVPNLSSFAETPNSAMHPYRVAYAPIHPALREQGFFSSLTANHSSANEKERDNDSEFSFY